VLLRLRRIIVTRFKYAAAAIALLPAAALAQTRMSVPCSDKTRAQAADAIDRGFEVDLACATNDITVTATRVAQPREQTGQAITVLDQTLLASRQSTSVADLLATTPGVTFSRNGGPGQTTAVRIRGAEDSQTLVLIDGVRVNDPASPGGAFDFGNLLTGNIDRIEVLRGPNSVPWGSQALGGVVNIVTAPAKGANLRAEYGYRNSKQIVGQAGGRLGPITASLGGGYFDDDGISAFKNGTERDGFRQYAGNARVGVEIGSNVSLDLRGYYADSKVQFDGGFPLGDTANFSKTRQAFGYAGLNADVLGIKNRLAFTLSDTARDSSTGPDTPPNFIARGRTERFEYQGDWAITDRVRAVFGIEHETSRFKSDGTRFSTGVTSGYALAIVRPVEQLTITGGIRVDDHKTYGTKTTLSANAALRVGSGTILRASYGEGFKAPTLFQLFDPQYGNTTVAPETARSIDLGIEQSLIDGSLKVGATAFRRDASSLIGFFDCFGVDPTVVPLCAGRGTFGGYYYNIDRTRTEGVEVQIEARPTSQLSLTANYSLIDAKDRGTGLVLLRRPKHSVNASIDWTPGPLTLGADVKTVSASRDFDFETFALTSLDGYTLATIRAAVALGRQFELFGRVENLFDEKYETVSGYGTLGRNAHVGVRAKF
jgi:vitamin B12 transporter